MHNYLLGRRLFGSPGPQSWWCRRSLPSHGNSNCTRKALTQRFITATTTTTTTACGMSKRNFATATRNDLFRQRQGLFSKKNNEMGWMVKEAAQKRWLTGSSGGGSASKRAVRQQQQQQVERGSFQRSKTERQPKFLVMIIAFGIAGGSLMIITFNAMSLCEPLGSGSSEADSVFHATEPITQTKFPMVLMSRTTSDSKHWLVCKTVRCMMGLCSLEMARAYSYGVYVSSDGLSACSKKNDLSEMNEILLPKSVCEVDASENEGEPFIASKSFQGAKPGYVFKSDTVGLGYYKDEYHKLLLQKDAENSYPSMVLRLVMLHDVEGSHVAHGFDRTLLNRIRDAQDGRKDGPGKGALRTLNNFITRRGKWEKGQILEFVRLPQGYVDLRVDGVTELKLKSESFSWALFDAYLGPKGHLSSSARSDFVESVKEMAKTDY